VVGVHLKSLRANLLALPALTTLTAAVDLVPGARLRVDVHDEALRPDFPRHDADLTAWLRAAAEQDRIDLRVHGRFDDEELIDYLLDLDVSVIAYSHGTHSGWLELCHDLGIPVLAGRAGFLSEQHAVEQVDLRDVESVLGGLRRALSGVPGATAEGRAEQRLRIAAEHRDLYRAALDRVARGAAVPR
jgi:beta-1,4-mannosyltransferase